jgi:hypothetical protein
MRPAFAEEKNPERNAYFGEEHSHTAWSIDAWVFGNRWYSGRKDAVSAPAGWFKLYVSGKNR